MAALKNLPGAEDLIRCLVVNDQETYEQVSEELQRVYPDILRGLSTRSVRRFCYSEGIYRRSRLSNDQLERMVSNCVQRVS